MSKHLDWCCRYFRDGAAAVNGPGYCIFAVPPETAPIFVMQFRDGPEPEMTLGIETQIRFCPWCGTELRSYYADAIESLLRPELALTLQIKDRHQYDSMADAPATQIFRIRFEGGDVFRVRCCSMIDPSVDGNPDGWSAEVVELVHSDDPKKSRFFRAGSGIDFVESDILEIFDESSQAKLEVS